MPRDSLLRRGSRLVFVWLALAALPAHAGRDAAPAILPAEDQEQQELIDQFAARQEAANWPEKFQRIGTEMGVPPDVLASIAFTETRWEQLTWPSGETVSPETGLPHPYGIMSLWDNDVLGHSLVDAANLIGSTPEALKTDPELNIRGAAALLKKYYLENPLPDGTASQDIESWQNAMVKYCGIQDAYLSYHHVFNCYLAMSQGYDLYGMHWKPHPVNLAPMRARVKALLAASDAARDGNPSAVVAHAASAPPAASRPSAAVSPVPATPTPVTPKAASSGWMPWIFGLSLLGLAWIALRRAQRRFSGRKMQRRLLPGATPDRTATGPLAP